MERQTLFRWVFLAAFCLAANTFSTDVDGQTRRSAAARTANVHWDQVPVADAVRRISDTYGVVVLLDRRADPTQRVSLDVRNADATEVLKQTADASYLAFSQIGSLMYLGPRSSADQLQTLAAARNDEASKVPVSTRAGLTQKRTLEWPRLTEPRKLITSAVAERGWQLLGGERIPHDLWPAGKLPDLTLSEQLTVLLAGFDLTFRVADAPRTIEIVPLSGPIAVTRRYRLRYGESDAARLREQFPDLQTQLEGDWISIVGRVEDHTRVAEWLAGTTPRSNIRTPAGPTRKVYTLRVDEQPLRAVIDTLAQRLSWKFEIDEADIKNAGLSLDRRVSFEVKNAGQDELLKAVLEPAGLTFRNEGEKIRVVPK